MNKNVWIDTVQLPENFFENIENSPKDVTFRMANTIDVKALMDDPARFEELLKSRKILVDAWGADALSQFEGKTFFSSALQRNVPKGKLNEIIPNAKEYAAIINRYAIPKAEWLVTTAKWDEFPEDILSIVDLEKGATRTDVFLASVSIGLVWVYEFFSFIYTRNLARQHGCTHVLKADGTMAPIDNN